MDIATLDGSLIIQIGLGAFSNRSTLPTLADYQEFRIRAAAISDQ